MPNKKSVLIFCIQAVISLGFLEIAAYFYLTKANNPLHRVSRIIRPDSDLGWRAKENLNTDFEGAALFTDRLGFRTPSALDEKAPSLLLKHADRPGRSIIILGPSSAFGWGVDYSETYGHKVAEKIKADEYNLSQIGFSSLQGLKLWEQMPAYQIAPPTWAIISYGINDLDKFRFVGTPGGNDYSFFEKLPRSVEKEFLNLNFMTVFRLVINEAKMNYDCSSLKDISQRLGLNNSETLLRSLIKSVKKNGTKIILVNTPYRAPPHNSEYSKVKIEMLYSEVNRLADKTDCKGALDQLKNAKLLEAWRVAQDVLSFNLMLKKLATEEEVFYVDAWQTLAKQQDQAGVFVDPVHPGKLGHLLISNEIISTAFAKED